MILWRRVDWPGHDACRLESDASGWQMSGRVAYRQDGVVTALSYHVEHDEDWLCRSAKVSGWAGDRTLDLVIVRQADGTWLGNSKTFDCGHDSVDIDLGFTPATNTTAIRRLKLALGQRQRCRADWLDTADWSLKPLDQCYARLSEFTYEYASPRRDFRTVLTTNEEGLVTHYPNIWMLDDEALFNSV